MRVIAKGEGSLRELIKTILFPLSSFLPPAKRRYALNYVDSLTVEALL